MSDVIDNGNDENYEDDNDEYEKHVLHEVINSEEDEDDDEYEYEEDAEEDGVEYEEGNNKKHQ